MAPALKSILAEFLNLNRTLASDDMDKTLAIIGSHMPQAANDQIENYAPLTQVWTWIFPERYVFHEAYLEIEASAEQGRSGERVVDFKDSPLHIISYSPPVLCALPSKPFEYATFKTCRVNIDYHVEFEKHFYSVPYALIHEEIRVRATEHMLEIFHKSKTEPVALHLRSSLPGRYSTQTSHMPPKHQKTAEWSGERLLRWAGEIGPQTAQLVQTIISHWPHGSLPPTRLSYRLCRAHTCTRQ